MISFFTDLGDKHITTELQLDFDAIYSGSILNGKPTVQVPNIDATLTTGHDLFGLTVKSGRINLGVDENCYGQSKKSDGNWCPDGFTVSFFIRFDHISQTESGLVRIFGNSDLSSSYRGFGIFAINSNKNLMIHLFFHIYKEKYYHIYKIGDALINAWFEVFITFDHVLGGFAVIPYNLIICE